MLGPATNMSSETSPYIPKSLRPFTALCSKPSLGSLFHLQSSAKSLHSIPCCAWFLRHVRRIHHSRATLAALNALFSLHSALALIDACLSTRGTWSVTTIRTSTTSIALLVQVRERQMQEKSRKLHVHLSRSHN